MTSLRKTSLVAGVFYLLTFVSIPTLALYGPVRGPNYILGPGPDTPVIVGAILEMIVALAGMIGPVSPTSALFALPIALWEFSLGIYLVVKGFRPSVITNSM
jgi:hypothetical protein